ncbi:MAG: molybdopterin-guanine dinucleotide biosynthesis protein B [Methylococcales bacterium]|nr:molybdopterin-guanine dinucleotide biosynthesis protein B [Methylococcales bacterium]
MNNSSTPVLGFAAISGTGKTTLLTQLIPRLKSSGLRVGLIKHSHHNFEVDKPGKDSYQLREAGASPVLIVSGHRRAIMTEFESPIEPRLADQVRLFDSTGIDLILVEGFKAEKFPKIELYRPSLKHMLIFPNDPNIIAIASDMNIKISAENTNLSAQQMNQLTIPTQLDINNPQHISEFIIHQFLRL